MLNQYSKNNRSFFLVKYMYQRKYDEFTHYLNMWPIMTIDQNLENVNQYYKIIIIFTKIEKITKVEEMNPNSE